MATTFDVQAQIAAQQATQQAIQKEQIASQQASEAARHEHEKVMESRRAKLELLRMAKETLVENARNKPVDEAAVTAADIVAFANELAAQLGE
jgi:predicted membrane chloride channel (bestrophin family)